MTIRPIVTLPDPILRTVSTPVERIDEDVQRLIEDLLETMYDAPGVGLAAIQIGVPKRVFVIDVSDKEDTAHREPRVFINPEIVRLGDGKRVYKEGCLSIPGEEVEIERPAAVTVRYLDRDGTLREEEVDGLLATAIQHERDHLDGRLIIDFLSRLRRDMVVRRFRKQARTA